MAQIRVRNHIRTLLICKLLFLWPLYVNIYLFPGGIENLLSFFVAWWRLLIAFALVRLQQLLLGSRGAMLVKLAALLVGFIALICAPLLIIKFYLSWFRCSLLGITICCDLLRWDELSLTLHSLHLYINFDKLLEAIDRIRSFRDLN